MMHLSTLFPMLMKCVDVGHSYHALSVMYKIRYHSCTLHNVHVRYLSLWFSA